MAMACQGIHFVSSTRDSATMIVHLADLSNVAAYKVRIEFTEPLEPYLVAQKMPYVSLLDEIDANSLTRGAPELRNELGRIPYSSPLYWWESYSEDGVVACEYIGQTVDLKIQKRFEQHAKVMRLLATHVNKAGTRVMFRMCSRLDIEYGTYRLALEHFPIEQAVEVVNDVEARLIFENQPTLNSHHKQKPKDSWKPFVIEECRFRE
jgi:hypothetical protein